jgi:hypothetical protein
MAITPDSTYSTLQAIQTKVRRLTRSPSLSQLSETQLNEYINTFILYDFPEHLRLFSLRTLLTFYTQPGVDVYETNTTVVTDPLYNFKNKYIAIHPPVFMAGIQSFFTQWRDVFFGMWPQTNTIEQTNLFGNNSTGPFTGFVPSFGPPFPTIPIQLPYPFILQRSVNFNCLDTNGTSMVMKDVPINNVFGNLTQADAPLVPPYDTIQNPNNYINYITGQYVVTFPSLTQTMAPIWFEAILYQPGKPLGMLYYDDKFIIRPVPDKTYSINIEVDVRPTELLNSTDLPQISQWWQYIAYGAAKKIFEDRMDLDSVNMIMPEFKQQERLVLRTTLTQQANERTVTIYTQGKNYNIGGGFFGGGGWPY